MSTNISKAKREELLRQVSEIRNKLMEHQDENTNNLLVYLSNIEKDINGKKYGLVFEEHREAVDDLLESRVPVLAEEESLKIENGGQQNFLIEGDNLASLKLLEKTHKGRIDFIYIDPPYNTGNKDFVYDDTFVGEDDKFRHSMWLSFMKKRLEIIKRLLSKSGIVCISIDDNEDADLTLLMNAIFGEENFIAKITREAIRGGSKSKFIRNCVDYVLIYAYDVNYAEFSGYTQEAEELTEEDEHGKFLKGRELNKWGAGSRREDAPSLWYPIPGPDGEEVYPIRNDGSEGRWRLGKKKMFEKVAAGDIIFEKRKNGTYIAYEKVRNTTEKIKQFTTLFTEKYLNAKGGERLKKIFGTMMSVFDYAKPVELIYDLILMCCPKDNSIILDCFAGSGTTGEATLQFNKDFNYNNTFILGTNNQNNICREITYERIKRVIDTEDYKASLKYYKVDFVPITEQVYYEYADKLLLHIKELVELENGLDFDGNKQVAICLTDEDLQKYAKSLAANNTYKAVYVGHDVFVPPEIENELSSFGIKINIIPDYYYGELRG